MATFREHSDNNQKRLESDVARLKQELGAISEDARAQAAAARKAMADAMLQIQQRTERIAELENDLRGFHAAQAQSNQSQSGSRNEPQGDTNPKAEKPEKKRKQKPKARINVSASRPTITVAVMPVGFSIETTSTVGN